MTGRQDNAPRLLHVFPSFARGGQQMRLAALARAFGDEFRHAVVSLDSDISARDAFADPPEIEVFALRKGRGISPRNVLGLSQLIASKGADLLCTYNFGAIEAALANAAKARLPHLHFEDGFGPDESERRQNPGRVSLRRLALFAATVVVPSATLEAIARDVWKVPERRLRRIPNGIDVARFSAPERKERPFVTVGSVGALRPEKNYARLVAAFRAVGAAGAALLIAGDGPERERLVAAAGEAALRVHLPGATAHPEAAYAGFDIFALSSDTEQMPLSLMEAMAAGLPVVATDVGDVKAMVAPENAPFITPLGQNDAFAKALAQLLSDAALRARLGALNAQKAARDFPLALMAERHRALINAALRR